MREDDALTIRPSVMVLPRPADNDERMVELWLAGKAAQTRTAYRLDVRRFLGFLDGKPLGQATVEDLVGFYEWLGSFSVVRIRRPLSERSKYRILASVRSLLTRAFRTGYIPFNAGAGFELKSPADNVGERILSEEDAILAVRLMKRPKEHAIVRLLYGSGIRRSELCGLTLGDLVARPQYDTGQITVRGKGGKVRSVLLSKPTWEAVIDIVPEPWPPDETPLFTTRTGKALTSTQVHRIVKKAGRRIGKNISAHWFRHAFASHALDRGAPVSLVQSDLGHSSLTTTSKYLHARKSEGASKYLVI